MFIIENYRKDNDYAKQFSAVFGAEEKFDFPLKRFN